jgi:hypothetical protein
MRRKPFQRVDKASIYPSSSSSFLRRSRFRFARLAGQAPSHTQEKNVAAVISHQADNPKNSQPPLPPQHSTVRSGQVSHGLPSALPPCIVPNRRNPYLHPKRPTRSQPFFPGKFLGAGPAPGRAAFHPVSLRPARHFWTVWQGGTNREVERGQGLFSEFVAARYFRV